MKNDQYYYGQDGSAPQGPLALASIRAAVSAGRLSSQVAVSRNADGPWELLSDVVGSPEKPATVDFSHSYGRAPSSQFPFEDKTAVSEAPVDSAYVDSPGAVTDYDMQFRLSGVLMFIGYFHLFLFLLLSVLSLADESKVEGHSRMLFTYAIACFFCFLLWLAISQILERLTDICGLLRASNKQESPK